MEPEIREFLKRVALSIFLSFSWLAINTVIGLRFDLAFVENKITTGNVLYYIWLTGSFVLLILFFIRMWRNAQKF